MASRFLALDFETANPKANSACSIGLVQVHGTKIIKKTVHLIRPPTPEFFFTYIHGIRWADVKTAPTFGELWPTIAPLFEDIDFLVAHNASFDSRVLRACCETYGIPFPTPPFQCTVQLARQQWNIRPTKLSDVCRHLNIPLNHHEALSDALAAAKIYIAASHASQVTP